MASQLRKKLGLTTKSDLEDIETARAVNLNLFRQKKISAADFKKNRDFLAKEEDSVIDRLEKAETKKKVEKKKEFEKKFQKRSEKVVEKVVKQLVKKEPNTKLMAKFYQVSFTADVEYYRIGPNGHVKYKDTVLVDERVNPKTGELKYDLLVRLLNTWFIDHKGYEPPAFNVVAYHNIKITTPQPTKTLLNVRMKGSAMIYKSLDDSMIQMKEGKCAKSYIRWESQKLDSRMDLTWDYLDFVFPLEPTVKEIGDWAREKGNISMYALDPLMNPIMIVIAKEKTRLSLFFVCNNGHCSAIVDEFHRRQITSKHKLSLIDLSYDYKCPYEVLDEKDAQTATAPVVIVKEVSDLTMLLVDVSKTFNAAVEAIDFYDCKVSAFKHPTKSIVFVAGDEWDARKAICDKFFIETRFVDFEFRNQSWGQISRTIFDYKFGRFEKSHYSSDLMTIFEQYPVSAYRTCENKDVVGFKSVDIRRCYTSILMENTEPWPVYGPFDGVKPVLIKSSADIKPGEYFINRSFYMGLGSIFGAKGSIFVSRGWYDNAFIKSVLKLGYIIPSDITFGIEARMSLPANILREFCVYMMETFPEQSKIMINCLIGCFGSLYDRKHVGGVSNDEETALALRADYERNDIEVKIHPVNDLFFLKATSKSMKTRGDVPLFRRAITQGWLRLDKLTKSLVMSGSKIVGYNTDDIKVIGPIQMDMVEKNPAVGGYHLETKTKRLTGQPMRELPVRPEYIFEPIELKERLLSEDPDFEADLAIGEASCLILGEGGTGKSWYLGNKIGKREGDVVLAFTHIAVENLKSYGLNGKTMDAYMVDMKTGLFDVKRLASAKRVIIDEGLMTPPAQMAAIVKAKELYGFEMIVSMGPGQCVAAHKAWVDYPTNREFLRAVNGNILTMKYHEGLRYDESLYKVLTKFRETGLVEGIHIGTIESNDNLCWFNVHRDAINKKCLAKWAVGRKMVKVGKMNICPGLEVMAYHDNDLKKGIFKTQRFVVDSIDGERVALLRDEKRFVVSHAEFCSIFDYTFALGVGKIQGCCIPRPHNIFNAETMSRNVLYTAMSRGVKASDLHIEKLRSVAYQWDVEKHITLELEKPLLQEGSIYEVSLADGSAYIGQTTGRDIEERLQEHIAHPTNQAMALALALGGASIRLLDSFLYEKKRTIDEVEKEWIERRAVEVRLLNHCHNVVVSVVKSAETKLKKERFNITEDAVKKRFRIAYRENGKQITKNFFYMGDVDAAYAKAVICRDELRAHN